VKEADRNCSQEQTARYNLSTSGGNQLSIENFKNVDTSVPKPTTDHCKMKEKLNFVSLKTFAHISIN
jgi:hypothetical protein